MAIGLPPIGDAVTWTGSLVIALVMVALSMQKALRLWSAGSTDLNRTQGENQVIKILREELDRLARHNLALDEKIARLNEVIDSLQKDKSELQTTVAIMEKEIAQLKEIRGA